MRSHYDPNQPRVPAGHHSGGQWTSDGSTQEIRSENLGPKLAFKAPPSVKPGQIIADAVAGVFALLSTQNTIDRRAVLTIDSIEYARKGESNDFEAVRLLNRKETADVCKKLDVVQGFVDAAASRIDRETPYLRWRNPAQYGMDVHREVYLKIEALGNPNFRSEVPMKAVEPPIPHANDNLRPAGDKDAKISRGRRVRPDSFENLPEERVVCLYEEKTGKKDMAPRTRADYVAAALNHFPDALRVIVMQVRPTLEHIRLLPGLLYGTGVLHRGEDERRR